VVSYGNVLGFSGTNMRYVTIEHSKWFNNGTGIVPNALHSEKYAPPEDNVITDNDVFWNNFNYYAGAPFTVKKNNKDATPYPLRGPAGADHLGARRDARAVLGQAPARAAGRPDAAGALQHVHRQEGAQVRLALALVVAAACAVAPAAALAATRKIEVGDDYYG